MEVTVPGMSCTPCSRAVTEAVHSVDPEAKVEVDLETKHVRIETLADEAQIAAAIEQAGYHVNATAG